VSFTAVLISLALSLALASSDRPILLKINKLKLVPEAGLEQVWALSAISNAHPQCLRHQRHAASKLSNVPKIRHFRRFVKPCYYAPTNHPVLRSYSAKTRSLALSLALFRHFFARFNKTRIGLQYSPSRLSSVHKFAR
jgi:hypothetical protein